MSPKLLTTAGVIVAVVAAACGSSAAAGSGAAPAARHSPAKVLNGRGISSGDARVLYNTSNGPALPALTAAQLAGQRVIYSYSGTTPPASLLTLIAHGEAAGVIFFSANIPSQARLAAEVSQLNRANARTTNPLRNYPLLLMTDQEGGLVRRLPWAPPDLSEKQIGALPHPAAAAAQAGTGAGANLRSAGINVNLAPVLDVYRMAGNFIDEFGRSYSSNPKVVSRAGQAFVKAQQAKGVAATVKHFPGLGAAARSQNTDLRPVTLHLSAAAIRSVDEYPYRAAISAGAKLVMVSWAVYPALDPRFPAGLSAKIVQGELRQRLGFQGVTITDALEAGALQPFGSIAQRSVLAARAGMDLLLCANGSVTEGESSRHALEAGTGSAAFKAAVQRILALRASLRH